MGGFGGDNLGDELICLSMISSLVKVCSEEDVKVFTFNKVVSKRNFKNFKGEFLEYSSVWDFVQLVKNFIRLSFSRKFEFLKSDVVVIGGGGLFYEYKIGHLVSWFSRALYLRLRNVDFIIHANSFHAPKGRLGAFFVKKIIGWAKFVAVRDRVSLRNLRLYGISKNIGLCNDVVFGIPVDRSKVSRAGLGRRVAFILRYWEPYGSSQIDFWAKRIKEILDSGAGVDLLCFDLREDVSFANAIRERVGGEELKVEPLSVDVGIESILSVISDYESIVTMRFHGLVLSVMAGVPVLSIAYDDKVFGLCSELGVEDFCKVLRGDNLVLPDLPSMLEDVRSKSMVFNDSCKRLMADKSYENLLIDAIRRSGE
ncbi:polysaccharide pyruvyl transferase family protein [Pseudomonas sp. UM16]|uniref:polysaccharide pyruvyl transferase family protein n=1 Tax=Pseudomonas sp. UM16 TaxID=3158962 RepID=UPI00398F95B9